MEEELVICEKVKRLMQKPQPAQRTQEWYDTRKTRVTASALASMLVRDEKTCGRYVEEYGLQDTFDYDNKCCNSYTTFEQFKLDKIKATFKGNIATFWGQRYEQVATDIYMLINNTVVIEFGLLAHDTLPWLAASPDGITVDGIMLEIKCVFRRKITGIPMLVYWKQVQSQLEVADLEYCDFFEVEFQEISTMSEFLDDSLQDKPPEYRGLYLQIESVPDEFEARTYTYPDRKLINDPVALQKWTEETSMKIIESRNFEVVNQTDNLITCRDQRYTKHNIRTVYWKTATISNVRIKRDREWFASVKDTLKERWDEVLAFKDNYVPGEVKQEQVEYTCMF
jgi:hypothetical protein